MNSKTAILFSVIALSISCSSVSKILYQDKGLSFKVTSEFKIGRSDTYKKNQSTYVPIEIRDENLRKVMPEH
jgi:hypothetical protein